MRKIFNGLVLAAAGMSLAGCFPQATDPLYRDGLWEPVHSNRANLALMVANPADLVRGTGRNVADGQLAAAAVERLRTDKVKKLPASDVATFGAGNSGSNDTSGSAGAP